MAEFNRLFDGSCIKSVAKVKATFSKTKRSKRPKLSTFLFGKALFVELIMEMALTFGGPNFCNRLTYVRLSMISLSLKVTFRNMGCYRSVFENPLRFL